LRGAVKLEVLAFAHPRAGLQLVKGTIEAGESPEQAALRELREEAGLDGRCVADLGLLDVSNQGQFWSFHRIVTARRLPDTWIHRAPDDGGHDFHFFWHPIQVVPSNDWNETYRRALAYIGSRIT
jgi:8-oxo-dGTP pyrophosphatase MutT (NUDIX family)